MITIYPVKMIIKSYVLFKILTILLASISTIKYSKAK